MANLRDHRRLKHRSRAFAEMIADQLPEHCDDLNGRQMRCIE
jgi:hypothetical protein